MPLEEKRNTDRNTVNPNAPLHKVRINSRFLTIHEETQESKKSLIIASN